MRAMEASELHGEYAHRPRSAVHQDPLARLNFCPLQKTLPCG